jgi:hypothetical protein
LLDLGADVSVQDIMNNLQAIHNQGTYQVAPKLPTPQFQLGSYQTASPVGGSALDRLKAAIKQQESGGNYGATNPSGASGAYQILRSNFVGRGGWDKEALGRDISYNEFMNSPSLQDEIAAFKLNQYLQRYGAAGAAAAWYGGPGAVSHMYDKTPQPGGYPSFYAYIQSVLNKM